MSSQQIQVYIVDDEPLVCTAYARLVRAAKMQPQTFESVEGFLASAIVDRNACVVSDVQFPGKSGLELPQLLRESGHHLPVIFVSARYTPEIRESAHQLGAVAYFRKPVDDQALLDAIAWALSDHVV